MEAPQENLENLKTEIWKRIVEKLWRSLVTGFTLRNLRGIPAKPENASAAPGTKSFKYLGTNSNYTTNIFIPAILVTIMGENVEA